MIWSIHPALSFNRTFHFLSLALCIVCYAAVVQIGSVFNGPPLVLPLPGAFEQLAMHTQNANLMFLLLKCKHSHVLLQSW